MSLDRELNKRSGGQCELCAATENLKVYTVLPTKKGGIDESVFACATCVDQIENPDNVDLNHWRFSSIRLTKDMEPDKLVSFGITPKNLRHKAGPTVISQGSSSNLSACFNTV